MDFFKSMSMSFKITIVDEYQDMNKFIDDIFVNKMMMSTRSYLQE